MLSIIQTWLKLSGYLVYGLISYMVVILFTWVFVNFKGYVYFSAGEPVLSIKYLEWVLDYWGFL